jgi:YkoP domain
MDALRMVICKFDGWLSRHYGVVPFTDDPHVILRLQYSRAKHDLCLPDKTIPIKTGVLLIHAWNERIPIIPGEGPDLAYGLKLQRLMINSYHAIAQYILANPSKYDIKAIGGITAHVSLKENDGGRAMLEHMGFTVIPYHRPFGEFGEFWENFYTWWLMWTYNPASVKHRSIWHLQRTEFWMTKESFIKKYG